MELLRARRLEPIVAVRPLDLEGARLRNLDAIFHQASVRPAYWPMLADEDGRWAAAGNVRRFADFARRVVADVPRRELIVDLEPPIEPSRELTELVDEEKSRRGPLGQRAAATVRALAAALDVARKVSPRALAHARTELTGLVDELAARGTPVSACVLPPLVVDRRAVWQTVFGTPLAGPRWHEVHVMLYSSMLEGWSRGTLRRYDARALVFHFAAATHRALGLRGSVAIGVVGTGAFGDEPVYRDVGELTDDVTVARAAGVDHLSLFDLGGVLRRERPAAWLDAFTAADTDEKHAAVSSLRARAVYGLAGLVGGV